MATLTYASLQGGAKFCPAVNGLLGGLKSAMLVGTLATLTSDVTYGPTSANVRNSVALRLYWYLPAGCTGVSITCAYNAELDVSGSRPYANLLANSGMGLAAQTVIAPSGGGSQTIAFSFAATGAAGVASFDLVVPSTGLPVNVTWTPVVLSGQSAVFSESGTPIVGAGGAYAFAFAG